MSKRLIGLVLSTKMKKTAVIEVEQVYLHPFYHKRLRRSRKYYVHNLIGAQKGDRVVIELVRPISKLKRWRIVKISQGQRI